MSTPVPRASAIDYTSILPTQAFLALKETPETVGSRYQWTERHLQCTWFDERYRPAALTALSGEPITLTNAGHWNLEAGPDFLDTVLWVGDPPRRICGDTEVHVHPREWKEHAHSGDPRYANVVLHVTYYRGDAADLPTGCFQLSLCAPLAAQPTFSFSDLDLSAYPHAALPCTPRPCQKALNNLDPEECGALLESAGMHRIQMKAARLAARLSVGVSREQLFYEEVMTALGYKKNRTPFRSLAQALPFASWGPQTDAKTLYAHLLGLAGLLPTQNHAVDPPARPFIRQLWDHWWRTGTENLSLDWHLSGSRPTNHPHRRLAAAAALFSGTPTLLSQIDALSRERPKNWISQLTRAFARRATMPFWEKRLSLTGAATTQKTALLGKRRIAAIISNVVIPLDIAERDPKPQTPLVLPLEHDNSQIRATAARLLGRDMNPAFYATGLRQQGLIQICQDFCLNTRSDCQDCTFAKSIRAGNAHAS